ncbi:conjugative transposon protein TraN [Nibrella saemangeumensis]|uniref:Conjugative transposon protein TraN n=1 Tax=Nibrella saemangeumensis TaxID=1084526 RepID=A0ABP8NC02_9BACT
MNKLGIYLMGGILSLHLPATAQILKDTSQLGPLAMANRLLQRPYSAKRTPDASTRIQSSFVELAFNKTTCLIFPSPIRSVDLGSRAIIADKASEVENVLRVKANQMGFNETNFSVITADGKFYSFIASYNEFPDVLAMNLAGEELHATARKEGTIQFEGVDASQNDIVYQCDQVMRQKRWAKLAGTEDGKMEASLRGIYVKDNVLYYKVALANKSNLPYELSFVRFFIVDKKVAKEASNQTIEVTPLYVYNEPLRKVTGKNRVEKVYAFQRFTIPNDKALQVLINEKNGSRTLSFLVSGKDIMNADTL